MTKLLYRGHSYERRSIAASAPTQLRYDTSHFKTIQPQVRAVVTLTYRGCSYTNEVRQATAATSSVPVLCYRGVTYS